MRTAIRDLDAPTSHELFGELERGAKIAVDEGTICINGVRRGMVAHPHLKPQEICSPRDEKRRPRV